MLLDGVREVAAIASLTRPEAVSQRAFDRARAASADHADLPVARQIAAELGLSWREVLAVALAPDRARSKWLAQKTRPVPSHGWLTDERIRFALRLVACRLGVEGLSGIAYDAERAVLMDGDARDWLHGRRLVLPSANAITVAAGGWNAALRAAGLKAHTRRKRTIHQVIVSRVEVMGRFYEHYGEQPSLSALKAFARGNKIPMSWEGGRKYTETVAEWRQRRRDRGLPEPRIVKRERGAKRPDWSADVGAAKPGEYLHRGKWEDEGLCVEWVAYYLSTLKGRKATAKDFDAWASRTPSAPTRVLVAKHNGWTAIQRKARARLKARGTVGLPKPGPPTPGARDNSLEATSNYTGDRRGSGDGG